VIAPDVRFTILSDETVSWPVIQDRQRPAVSLEDPVAAKPWFPNTSPLRVRFMSDRLVAVRDSRGASRAVVYSGFVSRTDAPGNFDVYVAVQIRRPCLLGVRRDVREALRLARDERSACIRPLGAS